MHRLELWGQQAVLRKAVPGSHKGGVTRSGISCTTAHVSLPAFSAVRLFPGRRGAALCGHKAMSHCARSVKCGAACQQGGAGPAPKVSGTGNASPVHPSNDGSAAACVHPWDKGQPRDQGWWGIMEPPSCCPGSPPGAEAPACPMSHLPLIALKQLISLAG